MKKQIPTKKHISLYSINKNLEKKLTQSSKDESFNFVFIIFFGVILVLIIRVLRYKNYI